MHASFHPRIQGAIGTRNRRAVAAVITARLKVGWLDDEAGNFHATPTLTKRPRSLFSCNHLIRVALATRWCAAH